MSTPEEFLSQGNQFCKDGNFTQAIVKYRQGLEASPPPVLKMFLNCELGFALQRLAGITGPGSHIPDNDRDIGYAQEAMQRFSEACRIFDKEIKGTPDEEEYRDVKKCHNEASAMATGLRIILADKSTADKSTKSGCFIATAAFGTPLAEEVLILSQFRDEYLYRKSWGIKLSSFYYRLSPPLASLIAGKKGICWLVRSVIIYPIVAFMKRCKK